MFSFFKSKAKIQKYSPDYIENGNDEKKPENRSEQCKKLNRYKNHISELNLVLPSKSNKFIRYFLKH